ncbi:uncharacterized protein LOC135100938 [Scylla paramamosain]|uniref:uncharacterized protein LOC135100938 n=1 Tax=Scylla paramamosain TaxID=85552 RepID=UPI0030833374
MVSRLLNDDQKERHMQVCQDIIERLRTEPDLLRRIITGIVHSEFLPQDQTITINKSTEILRRLLRSVREKRQETWQNNSCLLHRNSAPAHNALSIRQFLVENNITMLEQPPYSPDLAPSLSHPTPASLPSITVSTSPDLPSLTPKSFPASTKPPSPSPISHPQPSIDLHLPPSVLIAIPQLFPASHCSPTSTSLSHPPQPPPASHPPVPTSTFPIIHYKVFP